MSNNIPALKTTISDILAEYEEKLANIPAIIQSFHVARDNVEFCSTVKGVYSQPVFRHKENLRSEAMEDSLLKSAWRCLYNMLYIDRIATAKDKDEFNKFFENPIELNYDNIVDVFGDYFLNTRFHILRGIAECFVNLDPYYKSHSRVRIGVSGLPKRVILSGYGADIRYNYKMVERVIDIIKSLAIYRGQEIVSDAEKSVISKYFDNIGEDLVMHGFTYNEYGRNSEVVKSHYIPYRGITLRAYQNGNCHVIFDKTTLIDINKALAEFYGEALPDIDEEVTEKKASTAVGKDLQFYHTPDAVIEKIVSSVEISKRSVYQNNTKKVLEPSCGDGRILNYLQDNNFDVECFGIEYDAKRAAITRQRHNVLTANFLEVEPKGEYDIVIMNPPFNRWDKHIEHAMKFLKKGGTLVCVLPATAKYDHNVEGIWYDLPVASFRECGTNVPTGYVIRRKPIRDV